MGSGDAYLRTGRGGAGNFYSSRDVEEDIAKKDKIEDIEAQKPPAEQDGSSTAPNTALQSISASSAAASYLRLGRGGAGNFVIPDLPASMSSPPPPLTPPATSASASKPVSSTGPRYSGRGGAGNYDGGESEATQHAKEEQEARRKEALDAGLAQEIRASLPQQPKRTYHLHEPGRGRRPEDDLTDA